MRTNLARNVIVLSWVSLFQDLASQMLFPVLPLFVTGVLGAPVEVVSVMEGIADGISSFMKGIFGRFADRYARKPIVYLGYAASAIAKGLIGLASSWQIALALRTADRVGKGIRTSPRDALISMDTTDSNRGRAYGFHRGMDGVGAMIGPLVGLGLYELFRHELRPLFGIALIPALISVALISLVREPARFYSPRIRWEWDLPPRYWSALGVLIIFSTVKFSSALIILRLRELGASFEAVFIAYAFYNGVYALLSYRAGKLSDRIPRPVVLAVGLAAFSISFAGLSVATAPIWGALSLLVYGVFMAFTEGVATAWIVDLVPKNKIGTSVGLYYAGTGIAAVFAGAWAGLAWGAHGGLPFAISAAVATAIMVLLLIEARQSPSV